MLKDQTITNTWCCDMCSHEEVNINNTFTRIAIILSPSSDIVHNIDMCTTCVAILSMINVITYIESIS
jgi:hypothetical protein